MKPERWEFLVKVSKTYIVASLEKKENTRTKILRYVSIYSNSHEIIICEAFSNLIPEPTLLGNKLK